MGIQKEIGVFLKEVYLNILDNKHSSGQQKQYILGILHRICADPRALVEIYLNYDCDRSALNMFERYVSPMITRRGFYAVLTVSESSNIFRGYLQLKLPLMNSSNNTLESSI